MHWLKGLLAEWGYGALFGLMLAGNVGLPVPESSVLWTAGYLAWKGKLWLPAALAVAIVAAITGDNLGYWLGQRFGLPLLERYGNWAGLTAERLERMQRFVRRYGAFGVFFARFVTGIRFLAGPLAGSMGLPRGVFFVANALGAICYVPLEVGLGYALAYGVGRLSVHRAHQVEQAMLLAVAALACLALAYHLFRRHRLERR
jgi:membrane protein DedA with SNARE-associated domain